MFLKEGDSVLFFGDSNTENGVFIDYIRSSIEALGLNIAFFNKGIAGYRMDLCLNSLAEEIEFLKPNYAFINYGQNDIGMWLYENENPNEETINERKDRLKRYSDSLKTIINKLKNLSIIPIVTSPIAFNPKFKEKEKVESIIDNNEKKELLDDSIYSTQVYKRINNGLKKYRDVCYTISKDNNVMFLDIYSYIMDNFDSKMYFDDGTHLNVLGHKLLAKYILNFLDIKLSPKNISEKIVELSQKEKIERGYYFIKYVIFMNDYKYLKNEDMHKKLEEIVKNKGYVDGINEERKKGFDLYYSDTNKLFKKELIKMILSNY